MVREVQVEKQLVAAVVQMLLPALILLQTSIRVIRRLTLLLIIAALLCERTWNG